MATVTRLAGDLDIAEDAVQEACALAIERWPADGIPANLRARADLLRRLDRGSEAAAAYRTALELEPAPSERAFIDNRLRSLREGDRG